nr:hypothetical protein [Actinomycetota bacterium]
MSDPEGIVYDSDFGHLYIIGFPETLVFHVTTSGTLLRTVDISAAAADKPAGLAYGPGSANPGQMSLWIVDRGVDNSSDPNENDGLVYEVLPEPFSGNALPTVTITAPADGTSGVEGDPVTFSGTASDVEDGDLTSALSWSSSLDGVIGSGASFTTSALSPGTHTVTASVTDSGGLEASDAVAVTVFAEGSMSFEVRVATGDDDGEESESGSVSLGSSDLELVFDGSNQTVGMRFNGVAVPPGATVSRAYIQFQTDATGSVATDLVIQGEATDNASPFVNSTGNISSRPRTSSAVGWSPPAWTTVGAAGAAERTADIAPVIQEIVDRPGWSSGNSLVIVITGTGEREAESYDGMASAAPLLHVDYSVGSGSNTAPTATGVAISGTPEVGQQLTG